eukprot:359900-Chlamydomonas_euryale.AAC.3
MNILKKCGTIVRDVQSAAAQPTGQHEQAGALYWVDRLPGGSCTSLQLRMYMRCLGHAPPSSCACTCAAWGKHLPPAVQSFVLGMETRALPTQALKQGVLLPSAIVDKFLLCVSSQSCGSWGWALPARCFICWFSAQTTRLEN